MKHAVVLGAAKENVALVPINVKRDAPLGVIWLKGESGRETLRSMGVTDEFNHESTVAAERERLQAILDDPQELAWMIQVDDQIIGITETHLDQRENLPSPSIHIMIGNPLFRGQGNGTVVLTTVINYLRAEQQATTIFSRHLISNTTSAKLLKHLGFIEHGVIYNDTDGLEWQNMRLASH